LANIKVCCYALVLCKVVKNIVPIDNYIATRGAKKFPCKVVIEKIEIYENGYIRLTGWANAQKKITCLHVAIENQEISRIDLNLPRTDVLLKHPDFTEKICGFDLLLAPQPQSYKFEQLLNIQVSSCDNEKALFSLVLGKKLKSIVPTTKLSIVSRSKWLSSTIMAGWDYTLLNY